MFYRVKSVVSVFIISLFFLTLPARAMNLYHYDLDSLAYMSTDIVIVNLSIDSHDNFICTVTETLYGSLHAGDTLDTLAPFLLGFFKPMENGQRMVLFLDRRPQKYNFIYSELSKSPF